MQVFVVFALCLVATVAAAGHHGGHKHHNKNIVLDYVHNYRFEEHKKKNHTLLIAVSDVRGEKRCHVIEVSHELKQKLNHYHYMQNVTEEIYNLIADGNADEMMVNHSKIFKEYHDHKLVNECKHHRTYAMEYTPSFQMAHMTVDGNMFSTENPNHHHKHHHTKKHHHHSTHRPHHHKHHHTKKHHHRTTPSMMA